MDIFFFNDTATTEIYTLSLHDALPIFPVDGHTRSTYSLVVHVAEKQLREGAGAAVLETGAELSLGQARRSEEHTSELQSRQYLVCRLLPVKKKNPTTHPQPSLSSIRQI